MDKVREVRWGPTLFLIGYQALLLLSLPFYFYYASFSWSMVLVTFILLYVTGLSITAGYHRLYAHRSYRTTSWIEVIPLFFGSMAAQGSALRWAFDHRCHHAHVDTDRDPYSIKKGFWFAHFTWLLFKQPEIQEKIVPDLMRNKLVMFQHRYAYSLMFLTNGIVLLLTGWLLGDYLGALVLATGVRMFLLHHFTWFINSLAHTWGDRPFCQEQSAVNNYLIAFLTFGEGYHNFHHTFANDYRNGIRWYHFDPTKWIIWTLHKLGWAYNLKVVDMYTIKKRMVTERKNLLLESICTKWNEKREELEAVVNETSDRIVAKIAELSQLMEQYQKMCKECNERDLLKKTKEELYRIQMSLQDDWQIWKQLSRNILKPKYA